MQKGFEAFDTFVARLRDSGRQILEQCARAGKPCLLVVARPYHMDPGIGHEIEVDLQAYGYPVLWAQYLPTDPVLLEWMFGADIRDGHIKSHFDINDVWPSSYSANTNEILWHAVFFFSGSGFHQTCWLGENPHRNHRPLFAKIRVRDHREKTRGQSRQLPSPIALPLS